MKHAMEIFAYAALIAAFTLPVAYCTSESRKSDNAFNLSEHEFDAIHACRSTWTGLVCAK